MSSPKANGQVSGIHTVCLGMLLDTVQVLKGFPVSEGENATSKVVPTKVKARKVA